MALYFESLRIERSNLVLVFQRDVDQPVLPGDHAFAIAVYPSRTNHFASRSIDCRDVMGAMIVRKDPVGLLVVVDSVATLAHLNLLDQRKIAEIEDGNLILFTVRGEALFGRGDGNPMHAGRIFDCPNLSAAIGIEYVHANPMRYVDTTRVAVAGHIVPSFRPSNRIFILHLVWSNSLGKDRGKNRGKCEHCCEVCGKSHCESPDKG